MPKFSCHCGFVIPLSNVPSPHEASLISDADAEELCDVRTERIASFLDACRDDGRNQWIKCYLKHTLYDSSDASIIEEIVANSDSFSRGVIVCPKCGRLYVQHVQSENTWDCYAPEPDSQSTENGG